MKATLKRESWARLNFYVYAGPSIHCLYFIYARKIFVHSHGKLRDSGNPPLHCKQILDEIEER